MLANADDAACRSSSECMKSCYILVLDERELAIVGPKAKQAKEDM